METRNVIEGLDVALDIAGIFLWLPGLINRLSGKDVKPEPGKEAQAAGDAMKSFGLGFTLKDEMRLLTEVCILIDGKKITENEGFNFMKFLKDNPKIRGRFREGFVTEKDPNRRETTVFILAKMTDEQRTAFIAGPGFMDPSAIEKALRSIAMPLHLWAGWASGPRMAELQRRRNLRLRAAQATRKNKRPIPTRKPGLWESLRTMFSTKLFWEA